MRLQSPRRSNRRRCCSHGRAFNRAAVTSRMRSRSPCNGSSTRKRPDIRGRDRGCRALLEFGRHRGERLLGVGGGLGTDWVQYARNDCEVIVTNAVARELELVQRNFELRGMKARFVHALPATLPLEAASIDVVCLNDLPQETDVRSVAAEVYRVLKPGGKVLAVRSGKVRRGFLVARLAAVGEPVAANVADCSGRSESIQRPLLPPPLRPVRGTPRLQAPSAPSRSASRDALAAAASARATSRSVADPQSVQAVERGHQYAAGGLKNEEGPRIAPRPC